MTKILVTGVPGWLTDALLTSLAHAPLTGLKEVRSLVMKPVLHPKHSDDVVKFTFITGHLEDERAISAAVEGCDLVLHAAGLLHVRRTNDWYRVNTQGTEKLLRAAERAGVKRFVFVSSNAAAGRAPDRRTLMVETDVPRPLSHYGRSKLQAERLVLSARLESVVLRPCMFYGPPVPRRHVEIYQRILTGRMPLVGDGNYARSLTYIDNLVEGCRLALVHPHAVGQTYYIADEAVYTTREVVEAMAVALSSVPQYLKLPRWVAPLSFSGDRVLASIGFYWQTLHLVGEADWHVGVSVEKAKAELGYSPRVSLSEGMRAAVEWCHARKLLPAGAR